MTAGPIDTTPAIAQCEKCNAYVFQCEVNGCRVIFDPAPIPAEALVDVLTTGRTLYEGRSVGGKLHRLRPSRTLDGPRYASHGCCTGTVVRASKVEVTPEGPQQAPVTPGGVPDGCRPAPAPASGSQGHTAPRFDQPVKVASRSRLPRAATCANHPPSKPTRCGICDRIVRGDEPDLIALEYQDRMVWAFHGEC